MSFIGGGDALSTFDVSAFAAVDIAKDVQFHLQLSPLIQELVRFPFIGKDDAWVNGWIFDTNLKCVLENSQRCAIVINYAGGWTAPLEGNTVSFPIVLVDIWADPTRSEDNSVLFEDARLKCFKIHAAVKRVLHIVDRSSNSGEAVLFNTTRITSSELLTEPDLSPVEDSNGAYMLRARYGISYF